MAVSNPDSTEFQRAPGVPVLPDTPFSFILYFVGQYRWWYVAMLVFETLNTSCLILLPYALSRIIKTVTATHEQSMNLVNSLHAPLWLFFGLCLGEVVFGRLSGAIQIRLGPRQRQNVTRQVYFYLQHHSHRFFSNNFAGALAHRISEMSMGVMQSLWAIITEFWPIVIVFSVSIFLLKQAHITLALFVGIWAIFFLITSYFLARRAQILAFHASSARSETTGKLVDSVSNLTSSLLFARLSYEREYLEASLSKEMVAVRRSNGYTERVRWFQFSASAILKIGVLYYALTLWGQKQITVGDFVMAVSLSLMIINETRNLSRRFLDFFEAIGNVSNGVNTIIVPHEIIDQPAAISPAITRGEIHFKQVDFSYLQDKPVFRNLNVHIAPGQRVGLVGLSGSGKSTFVSLILRLYDVQAGQILIDGIDIQSMRQESLHQQLSLIPQDPSLFHRTLTENIRYGKLDASDDEIVAAAQKAHAHPFIAQMSEQYQSLVGERGIKVSGGQRQRIAIARVLLKNAPILILDEATSSLDSITERAIQDTLEDVMQGKTVLVVAHRLSTISHLDRILVFNNGQIVEDGSHGELLARQGRYYQLWSKQSDGFLPDHLQGETPAQPDIPQADPELALSHEPDDDDHRGPFQKARF